MLTNIISCWNFLVVAHDLAVYMCTKNLAPTYRGSVSEQHLWSTGGTQSVLFKNDNNGQRGLTISNPIGLAAGFDKNGDVVQPMLATGFGFVEVGTVTPLAQPGNPKPRMFRLKNDRAIINRYGFNSVGAEQVRANLDAFRHQQSQQQRPKNGSTDEAESTLASASLELLWNFTTTTAQAIWQTLYPTRQLARGVVGVNVGKNKTTKNIDAIADYVTCIQRLGPVADYLVVNVSSPNTAGLRDMQESSALEPLLKACLAARNALLQDSIGSSSSSLPPLLVKVAPDLTDEQLCAIADVCLRLKVDGIVVSNTTNQRPANLLSPGNVRQERGGLSGRPLKDRSTACIRKVYAHTNGTLPIIGVGGVSSGRDAYEKLRAGASLVQVYSGLIYEGPGVVSRIRHELAEIMLENGEHHLKDVVGAEHEAIVWKRREEQMRQKDARRGLQQNNVLLAD